MGSQIRTSRHPLQTILLAAAASILGIAVAALWEGRFYTVFPGEVYLPLHAMAEMASMVISFAIFALYWNAYNESRDGRGIFLGTAFLAVAILDGLHILGFPGMPPFITPSSTDKGIWFFLAARLWATVALVVAAFLPENPRGALLRPWPLLACNLVLTGMVFLVVNYFPEYLPRMFVEGRGLTPLKTGLEFAVVGLSSMGAVIYSITYLRTRNRFFELLAISLIVGGLGELYFTLYTAAYDLYNLLGHLYKIVAYYLIFTALFVWAIRRPYQELEGLYDRIENELKRTIARLDTIISSMPDGVVIYSPAGLVVRMNAAAEAMLGYKWIGEPDVLERAVSVRAETPEGAPIPREELPMARALRGETVRGMVMVLHRPSGSPLSVSASAAPILTSRGPEGAVVSYTDITVLRELQDQQDDLVRMLSHDLRSPLTAILGQAQLLQRTVEKSGGDTRLGQSAEAIAIGARRMDRMIRDLVEISRMESHQMEVRRSALALAPFISEMVSRLSEALDTGRIRVEVPGDLPEALVDPTHLERILTNLLSNALKYSPADAPVVLAAGEEAGRVELSVADRGMGIAPEDLPRIFSRFFRARAAQRTEGIGLGLYITRMLVEANNGRIWVESELGKGSTFHVSLPASQTRQTTPPS